MTASGSTTRARIAIPENQIDNAATAPASGSRCGCLWPEQLRAASEHFCGVVAVLVLAIQLFDVLQASASRRKDDSISAKHLLVPLHKGFDGLSEWTPCICSRNETRERHSRFWPDPADLRGGSSRQLSRVRRSCRRRGREGGT